MSSNNGSFFKVPLQVNLTIEEIVTLVSCLESLAGILQKSGCNKQVDEYRRLIQRLETDAQASVIAISEARS